MNTTDEQIKTVEKVIEAKILLPHVNESLAAILAELRESRELLEAATEIHFEGDDTSIRRLGGKPYEYGTIVEGDYGRGDYSSALDAFAEVNKQGEGK